MKKYKIAVAGTGYVGLSIATLLSQHHHVTAVDIVPEKVEMINNRKSPIQDDYIEKYLAEKDLDLTATLDAKDAYSDEKSIKGIDFRTKTVTTSDGEKYKADIIITTIPWMEFDEIEGMPKDIKDSIKELKFSSIQTEYFSEHLDTTCQWIYYPNPELPYHRILVRHNFCPNSRGYWTETNSERINMEEPNENFKYMNQYAYPLNTIRKPEIMKQLLTWSRQQGVIGLGRWGEHQHYNSDLTVQLAMELTDKII